VEVNIINLFGFILKDNISKWGEFVFHDHWPSCTFEELEQAFCKHFQTMKNDKEVYMQPQNIKF
jgi:hypothetical protein